MLHFPQKGLAEIWGIKAASGNSVFYLSEALEMQCFACLLSLIIHILSPAQYPAIPSNIKEIGACSYTEHPGTQTFDTDHAAADRGGKTFVYK